MKDKVFIVFIFGLSGLLGFLLSAYVHAQWPFTQVTEVAIIQTYHYPASFVKQLRGDPKAGEKIFTEFCSTCHGKQPTIDINAPRINNRVAWRNLNKLGKPKLLQLTISGVGAMPARGGCFECSDEQLLQAISYLTEK